MPNRRYSIRRTPLNNRLTAIAILVLLIGVGCEPALSPAVRSEPPVALATLQDARITEASGIAASRKHPGYFYMHNDSGDRPRVFLVDRHGRTWAEIRLRGASAVDYEDIAVAPGTTDGQSDVCVADIGDNNARRDNVRIYRFPEPELPENRGHTLEIDVTTYTLRYPSGPANAESFLVHPHTGDGYIITKHADGGGVVYKLPAPWSSAEITTLTRLADLDLPAALLPYRVVTGGDISVDGTAVVLRCYADGWLWSDLPREGGRGFEAAFSSKPVRVDLADEPQGEAICFSGDGEALLTVSEGKGAALHEVRFAAPASAPSR